MCGIIGILANQPENIYKLCLESLQQLQNRGYDSAGICVINQNNEHTLKYASDSSETSLEKLEKNAYNDSAYNGIGHTRWATHGPKTDINSHPHISMNHKFALVHNGIIENYAQLKEMLIENGFTFKSQTDSEVIVNLLEFYFNQETNQETNQEIDIKDRLLSSIIKTENDLQGTWGLVIQYIPNENFLFATRHGSPLLLGHTNEFCMLTSEQSGFCNKFSNYITLKDRDIVTIEKTNESITFNSNESYIPKSTKDCNIELTPGQYPHWTLKEIHEQIDSSLRAISLGGRLLSSNEVKLGGLNEHHSELVNINNLILLGCGTSYFAGLHSLEFFRELSNFDNVMLYDGADFVQNCIPTQGKTALVLLSQSGETQDLYRCLRIAQEHNLFTIGVVNVVDSLIAREVDCGCYLNAGREVGVASTKAYTSTVIILSMIAVWFAQERGVNEHKRNRVVSDLRRLHLDIENCINSSEKKVKDLEHIFENKSSCFILGKGKSESVAKEGALKIKEISYIHAEGYSTSSLKHGPFALLEKDFPVVLLLPKDEHYAKGENAYEEIKSRHANVLIITDYEVNCENVITIPQNKTYTSLLSVIPLQLLAYNLSISRGFNPDMPRNLAKVVTVE
jgi:glucosamine--fructose-6-phosphate aminotransferase (isomerizing)